VDIKVILAVVVVYFLGVEYLHLNDANAPAHASADVALVAAPAAAGCVVAVLGIVHDLWNGESMIMMMMMQM
jgi:hypothetical protein